MDAPQYITDDKGKKLSVVLSIKEYKKIMEELEDLKDIKAYDRAMNRKQEFVPLDKAIKEMEATRKKKK